MAQLRYWGNMIALTGKKQDTLHVTSVREALCFLERQYGKNVRNEARRMLIAVDGTSIQLLKQEDTPLSNEAVVTFYPLSGGG